MNRCTGASTRTVFGEATLEVRAAYQALSLQAPKLNQEPDDHIGLEFDFMAQLTLQVIDALYGDDAARAEKLMTHGTDFLRDHLLAWAPQMLDLATQHAQTHFMKGVVLLSIRPGQLRRTARPAVRAPVAARQRAQPAR